MAHKPTDPPAPIEPCESCGAPVAINHVCGKLVALEKIGTDSDGEDIVKIHRHDSR